MTTPVIDPPSQPSTPRSHPLLSPWVLSSLLALALVGMVVLSLVVNLRIAGAEMRSTMNNQALTGELRLVSGLRDLAVSLDAPGNDVFLTDATEMEAARFTASYRQWEAQLDQTENVLLREATGERTAAVRRDLQNARTDGAALRLHAEELFRAYRQHRLPEAGRHMAQMDQKLFSTLTDLQALRNDLTEAQDSLLRAERAAAEASDRLLRWAAAVMLLLAVVGGWFGIRLARLADRQSAARERTMLEVAQARESLEAAHLQLTAAHQELETFSSSVAHDLRAPLRGIQGFSVALQEDLGPRLTPAEASHLEHIKNSAATMNQLIEDLLALAHVSSRTLVRVPLDLSGLADEVLEELMASEPKRMVDVRITPGLQVVADPGLTRLLLQNLLGNAWKFTREALEPRIELFQEEGDERQGPVFVVRDNGAGFQMDRAQRLFIAFQRLHNPAEFEGTGIGLATVHRIVRRHGGTITAVAVPRRGATFRFTLGPQ